MLGLKGNVDVADGNGHTDLHVRVGCCRHRTGGQVAHDTAGLAACAGMADAHPASAGRVQARRFGLLQQRPAAIFVNPVNWEGIRGSLAGARRKNVPVIVVDAPATGHAITFLTSASGLVNAARGGPLRSQASDVVELLADPSRCRVMLVTHPVIPQEVVDKTPSSRQ